MLHLLCHFSYKLLKVHQQLRIGPSQTPPESGYTVSAQWVCVCGCVREGGREGGRAGEREREREEGSKLHDTCQIT